MHYLGYVILFLATFNAYAGVYKWVDAEGKVHYSDKRQAATSSTTVKMPSSPTQEELSQAQQRRDRLKQLEEMHRLKKEEQLKKDVEAQVKIEDKKKRCLKLLDEIEHAKYARAVYFKNALGEKVYVNDTTRNQHVGAAQSVYDQNCR
jgi:vacuolar-type H+-ATPase subunit I/STV1